MNNNNGHPKKPNVQLSYQIEGENEPRDMNLTINKVIKGSPKEIELIEKILSTQAGKIIAIDKYEIITMFVHPENHEMCLIMTTLPDEIPSKIFKITVAEANIKRTEDNPLEAHFSPDFNKIACEIEPNKPIITNIESIEIINTEEYIKRYEEYAKDKNPENLKNDDAEYLKDNDALKAIETIDQRGTDHIIADTPEHLNEIIEIFKEEIPEVIGIDERDIYSMVKHQNEVKFHKITISNDILTQKWLKGISQKINEKTQLYASKNLRVIGYVININDIKDVGIDEQEIDNINNKENIVVAATVESVEEVSEKDIRDKVREYIRDYPEEALDKFNDDTPEKALDKLKQLLAEPTKDEDDK